MGYSCIKILSFSPVFAKTVENSLIFDFNSTVKKKKNVFKVISVHI